MVGAKRLGGVLAVHQCPVTNRFALPGGINGFLSGVGGEAGGEYIYAFAAFDFPPASPLRGMTHRWGGTVG
ncbi:MAG: hypothetical protein KJ069_05220 [Anaerolineae bacterium]|nr:hypothetical protein [Anaerolineae bacterium]